MNDIYGVIFNNISKSGLSKKFKRIGWEVRKSGFDEYEIQSEIGELNINGENEILLNGTLSSNHFDELEKQMIDLELLYKLEQYDDGGQLIKMASNIN